MIGRMTWNVYIAACGMLLTFLFSMPNNLLVTSLLRSVYVFVFLFLLGFVLRFLLGTVVGLKALGELPVSTEDEGKGGHVDLSTPEEGGALLQDGAGPDSEEDAFKPLNWDDKKEEADPEKVVRAVRQLNDE